MIKNATLTSTPGESVHDHQALQPAAVDHGFVRVPKSVVNQSGFAAILSLSVFDKDDGCFIMRA